MKVPVEVFLPLLGLLVLITVIACAHSQYSRQRAVCTALCAPTKVFDSSEKRCVCVTQTRTLEESADGGWQVVP